MKQEVIDIIDEVAPHYDLSDTIKEVIATKVAQAVERGQDKWLSTKDRMPDNDRDVLFVFQGEVYLGNRSPWIDSYGNPKRYYWQTGGVLNDDFDPAELDENKITHWRELPSSPKPTEK